MPDRLDEAHSSPKGGRTEALLNAARILGSAGRSASRQVLLGAVQRRDDSGKWVWHAFETALKAGDLEFAAACLAVPLAAGDREGDAAWRSGAREALDRVVPFTAEALRAHLFNLSNDKVLEGSGPLCYVLHMSLPQNTSGYASRSQAFIRALKDAGLPLYCVTRPGFPFEFGFEGDPVCDTVDEVVYHRVPEPNRKSINHTAYALRSAEALVEKLGPLKPRAVMAASNHDNAAPALLAARKLGVPFIYDMRGFWELSRQARFPDFANTPEFTRMQSLETEIAKQADLVFTITGAMRDELKRRGATNTPIELLPNAADPEVLQPRPRDRSLAAGFGLPDDVPVIGYIGSFNVYEGLDDLVRACVALHRRGQDFRLLLVGSEPPQLGNSITPELRRLATEGGIGEKLIMPGRVSSDEVARWYSLIDIAPVPRKSFPVTEMVSPLKPLEAMAMGKAVVVPDLAPMLEIVINGKTGVFYRKGDTASLSLAIEGLLKDRREREKLGSMALKNSKKRGWRYIAEEFMEKSSGVISCPPPSR